MTDKPLSLILAVLLLTGCALPGSNHAGTPSATAEVIDSTIQCSADNQQPTVQYISNRQQLKQMVKRLQGSVFPAPVVHPLEIDFSRWNVLYISSGQKPTAGYFLELAEPAFVIQQDKARLNVILNRPPPDAMVAAVITHPCILVKVPAGSYSTIEVHGLGTEQRSVGIHTP